MSKLKSPQDKKRASLERDCRNAYGESPHAARKNIPKRKAMQHQEERRAATQTLALVAGVVEPDALELAEGRVKAETRAKRLQGFKKHPDQPLAETIKEKQARRRRAQG